jgi:hypothetical protein
MLKTTINTVVPATLDIIVCVAKRGSSAWKKPTVNCLFGLLCIGVRAAVDQQMLEFAKVDDVRASDTVQMVSVPLVTPAEAAPQPKQEAELVVRVPEDVVVNTTQDSIPVVSV